MDNLSQGITIVVGVAISLAIVAIGVISLFLNYRNKRLQAIQEKEKMQAAFNEQLLQAQLEMQEQTFNVIGAEIHDNVGQVLSLAKVQLNIIDQGETLDRSLLADAKESVSKALTDLRDIAKSLNSERIKLSSLQEITAQELQRINRLRLIGTSMKTEGETKNLQEQKKLIIFRIIQESLQNIIKHSKAKNIDIWFHYEKDILKIEVMDNGTGFDKTLLEKKEGLGLQNIVSRALLIGGEANINSTPGKGTVITIISPYE
jgi:two-component system NarL family sensor kinase